MSLKRAFNVSDLRRKAQRRLPKLVFDFLDGGVLDEYTKDANERDFKSIELSPKPLADLSGFDTGTTVLGTRLKFPLMVSPMGVLTMFHPRGDAAIAREAMKMDSIFMHSYVSGVSIEDTARAIDPDRLWAQTTLRSAEENAAYRQRVANLGIRTLIIPAEPGAMDKRERDLRNGLSTMPPQPPLSGLVNFALHPGWVARWLTGPPATYADHLIDGRPMKMKEMYSWMGYEESRRGKSATEPPRPQDGPGWEGIRRSRDAWDGNVVLKGVATPEAALQAVEIGADAILVSNTGGRRFDGQPSTISVLPEIVETIRGAGSSMEIYVDSGVRRGHDVVRALALGANAASAGRAFAYGLGAYGQEGVEKAFRILHEEFEVAMKAVGAASTAALDNSVIVGRTERKHSIPENELRTGDGSLVGAARGL
jgi:L-lactate dehydrogenase (cytochrome)